MSPISARLTPSSIPSLGRLWRAMLVLAIGVVTAAVAHADPVDLNIPAQSGDRALLAFSKQAKVDVLFSFDDLRQVQSQPVVGRYEPADALTILLRDTGFVAQRNGDAKFIVTRAEPRTGSLNGRLVTTEGLPIRGAQVAIAHTTLATVTNDNGDYELINVPPGAYRLLATADGYQSLQIVNAVVVADRVLNLGARPMPTVTEPGRLDPFVVEGKSARPWRLNQSETEMLPRTAAGNLDLARTEDEALPYTIYNREQISRSGVINLNEFLQRELLDADAASLPPEQVSSTGPDMLVGSSNLRLRGYGSDSTVVLVNGRRMPEMLTNVLPMGSTTLPPDVNFIPLSLVQQIQVLPASASALYSGSAVGGVINIVLRPDIDADWTEVNATYTNALHRYDAPQSSISLLHARSLLQGKLRMRFNVTYTQAMPATEAELGYHRAHPGPLPGPTDYIHRATPNVQSADGSPLFGPGTASVTSVAPGANGNGGLAAFSSRQGLRDLDLFQSPGRLAVSNDALDFPYGRRQHRTTYFGSVVSDTFPWLQLGTDIIYSQTVVNRGYDVPFADLTLHANSPFNPFNQDVVVSLNESLPALGENYNEARLDFSSAIFGAVVKLPANWTVSLDAQYAHNIVKYRGLAGADPTRWQQLVDAGKYNPLRDTQIFGPPPEFYDQVLIYRGGRGQFVTLGDYDTLDLAFRTTNENLKLPTGLSTVNVGGDYRRNHLNRYSDERRYGDGTLEEDPIEWSGRTIARYSVFGELRAPVIPEKRLPRWLHKIEADLAVRYIVSSNTKESNVAPTIAFKADLTSGFSLRGSVTTSNRLPTPQMSRQVFAPSTPGSGIDYETISDPRRNERYAVQVNELLNPSLRPEEAVTQTAGLIYQVGKVHRFRGALDYVDTQKINELVFLGQQDVVNLEAVLPERVTRGPLAPNDPHTVGPITSVVTSTTNLARRYSQNWNVSFDYAWTQAFGGTLEAYARLLYFQTYKVRLMPNSGAVDEIKHPDSAAPDLLQYRANFGTGWFNRTYGFGMDGRYFHSRNLPPSEWALQGSTEIKPYWQLDGYAQVDLRRWLPWKSQRYGLKLQARVNNLFGFNYPKYVNGPSDAYVQPYGDWRGRVYSLSVTATF